jgi:hypothetical protein
MSVDLTPRIVLSGSETVKVLSAREYPKKVYTLPYGTGVDWT